MDDASLRWYIDKLLAQWQENERSLTRLAGLVVLLGAAFVLLRSRAASDVSVGFAKVTNVSAVEVGITVFVSYVYYSLSVLFLDVTRARITFNEIVLRRLPALNHGNFQASLYPGPSLYWDQIKLLGNASSPPKALIWTIDVFAAIRVAGAVLAIHAFLLYSELELLFEEGYLWLKLIGVALVLYWLLAGLLSMAVPATAFVRLRKTQRSAARSGA